METRTGLVWPIVSDKLQEALIKSRLRWSLRDEVSTTSRERVGSLGNLWLIFGETTHPLPRGGTDFIALDFSVMRLDQTLLQFVVPCGTRFRRRIQS